MLCFYAYFWSKGGKWICPVLCIVEEIDFDEKSVVVGTIYGAKIIR
jgi:hypothetical protein